jgi:16S rRNA (adenine1518-N6/adenine1519-N6)-dimethyltransferase
MLRKYGLAPSRQRGQNFLVDDNVVRKLVAAAVGPDDDVVEIGPGFGAITFRLAEVARHVVAVEFDAGIARAFRAEYGEPAGVTLVDGDILEFDFGAVARLRGGSGLVVVGNIPYGVTSPLIRRLIENRGSVARAVLMVQREVSARLVAGPGDPDYSALSVIVRFHSRVRSLFSVRRTCFYPRPNVDSGVVELDFDPAPVRRADPEAFAEVVRAAFGKRRKMLRRSLRGLARDGAVSMEALEDESGVDLARRAETLSLEEFEALTVALGGTDGRRAQVSQETECDSGGDD